MPIKRILLPISGEDAVSPLAETAFYIGQTQSAQVQGVFAQSAMLNISLAAGATTPEATRHVIQDAQEVQKKLADRAEAFFASYAARYRDVESSFVSREGDVSEVFLHHTRLCDLVVTGSASQWNTPYWRAVRNVALFRSGRPVLVVPAAERSSELPDKAAIAWKESLEASRAIAAAQAFLAKAREVHLVAVGEGEEMVRSLRDVEAYLLLHYGEIRTEMLLNKSRNVSEALLDKAERVGALLIMGAYSHWRWQEQVFGGVTETMLRKATIPLLMMH